ncbi:MAG: hypothetical protein HYU66_08925, partial [Armatimonadetes bacterium]|nr:hypothetical protein [Armatimonadota bacterium]
MKHSRSLLAALACLVAGLAPAVAQDIVISAEVPDGGGSGGGGGSVNVVTMGPDDFEAIGEAVGGALQAVADFLWPFEPAPAPPSPPPEAPMSTPPAGFSVDDSALFHQVPHAPGERASFQDDVLEGHDPSLPLRGNPHAGGTEFTGPPSGLDPTRPNDNREMRPAASQTAGDPVSLGDGELVLHQTDLSLSGPVRPLRFERVYRSRSDERSVLGSNWTFNWDVWLRPLTIDNAPTWVPHRLLEGTTPKAVLLHDGIVGSLIFVTVGAAAPNDFVAMSGSAATLRRLANQAGWELQDPDGRIRTFNKLGYLTEDRDRFGNGYRLEYEPTHLHTMLWRFFIGGHPLDEEEKPSVQVRYALGLCPARQWYHEDNYAYGASQVFWDFIRPNMWSSFRFQVQQNFVDDPFNKAAVGNLRTTIVDSDASTLTCQLAILNVLNSLVNRRSFYRDLKRDFGFTDARLVGRPRAMLDGLIADGLFTNADGTPKGSFQAAEETRLRNFNLAVLAEGLYDPHFQPIDEEPSHPLVEPAPGGTTPAYRGPLENEFHPVRFDDHAWFEESCRVLHSYLFEPDGAPVAWTRMALDGGHQLRPIKVTDDLGNQLTFDYYPATTADEPNAGLLKQVTGPAGTKLTFEYTGPPYQPYQNHERLLRKAARIDAPPASTNITAAPEQNYVFDYQWQRGLMNKLPDLGWQVWDLYHRAGFPAAVPMTAYYLSQVSDNIIGVWRNVGIAPEIESETAYMVHPFSPVFDRVMRQRAGGSAVQAAGQNYGEF